MVDWRGNLDDDCSLERYGMLAHVEKMDRGRWWFAISRGRKDLFNSADNETYVKLPTGDVARAAAESVMECLRKRK